jgi:hypothetical protein
MSISKNTKRRKSLPSAEPRYPNAYVLPEQEIRALFEETRHDQIDTVAARMQVIVDVTDKSAGGKLAQADLQYLKQVAAEDSHPDHQRLMQALLQAVAGGKAGLAAARQTAAHLVERYFLFSRERYLGLKMYEARLRRSRLADDRDG